MAFYEQWWFWLMMVFASPFICALAVVIVGVLGSLIETLMELLSFRRKK